MTSWLAPPQIIDGENVLWGRGASRPYRWRLVGGRLYLTQYRLMFQPNRVEAAAGAVAWSVSLSDIVAVGPEPWLRRRLRIDVTSGEPQRFLVRKIDRTGEELVALVNRLANPR